MHHKCLYFVYRFISNPWAPHFTHKTLSQIPCGTKYRYKIQTKTNTVPSICIYICLEHIIWTTDTHSVSCITLIFVTPTFYSFYPIVTHIIHSRLAFPRNHDSSTATLHSSSYHIPSSNVLPLYAFFFHPPLLILHPFTRLEGILSRLYSLCHPS